MHIRRCIHELPILKHSSQPSIDAGSAVTRIWSRWLEAVIYRLRPGAPEALSRASLLELRSDHPQLLLERWTPRQRTS